MKLTNIFKGMDNLLAKTSVKIEKHSPEILITLGIVGVVGSTIIACRATTKVKDIFDESKETLSKVREGMETGEIEGVEYSKEDGSRDTTIIYVQTGFKIVKLYAPAVILGTLSLASIISSNNILRTRNIALGAAYATLDKSIKDYRNNVVNRFGEKVDRELRHNLTTIKQEMIEVDENGKEKKVKKEIEVANGELTSEYASYFDEGSVYYQTNSDYNMSFLKAQQSYANDILQVRGHIFLNEIYDNLGLPRTKAGQIVGWTKNGPDGYVNFRINEVYRKDEATDIYKPVIMLDFNVEGNVWDKM